MSASWLRFDGMTWPNPADPEEIALSLCHGPLDRETAVTAASFISAYRALVDMPARRRAEIVRELRKGAAESAEDGPTDTTTRGCAP